MKIETQRDVLIWMLNQVRRVKEHQRELAERLERINAERETPIGSPGYDPLPRTMEPGSGAASILFKLADIEDRLYDQKVELEQAYVRVMDIIDFIPIHSDERRIFELRHLDCMKMRDVADLIPMHFTRAYEKYNSTIDKLLTYDFIQEKIVENEEQYLEWYIDRDNKNRKRKRNEEPEKDRPVHKPQMRSRKRKRKK